MGFLSAWFLGVLLLSVVSAEAQFCERFFRLFPSSSHTPPAVHLEGEVKKLSYGKMHIGMQVQYPHQGGYKVYGDGIALVSRNFVKEGEKTYYGSQYSLDHRFFALIFSASVESEVGESSVPPTIYTHYIYWNSKSRDMTWEPETVKQIFEKFYGKNPLQKVKELLMQKENAALNEVKTQDPHAVYQDSRGNVWHYGGSGEKVKTYFPHSNDLTKRGKNGVLEPFLFRTEKEKSQLKQVIMEVLGIDQNQSVKK